MSFSFFVFIILPILELTVFVLVGKTIGWGETLLLTLTTSLAGILLTRSRSIRSGNLAAAMRSSPGAANDLPPGLHPILAFLGGILLIFPGFVTDLIGAALLFPFGRRLMNRLFRRLFVRGNSGGFSFPFGANPFFGGFCHDAGPDGRRTSDSVFDAEVRTPQNYDDGDVIDVDFTVRGR